MSSELSTHGQETAALQARMQASNQEHVKETQQLNSKVRCHQPLTLSFSICWVCCQVIECSGCVCVAADPKPARTVREWAQCSAGSSATGELYSPRCPQQSH